MENINGLSIIISTLIPPIVGSIFYHESVMGRHWMHSLKLPKGDLPSGSRVIKLGVLLITSFLLSFFLLSFNNSAGQEGTFDTFGHGVWHGVFTAIVVALPIYIGNGVLEQRSWQNLGINSLYWIASLALMGGVLDAMNHWPNFY